MQASRTTSTRLRGQERKHSIVARQLQLTCYTKRACCKSTTHAPCVAALACTHAPGLTRGGYALTDVLPTVGQQLFGQRTSRNAFSPLLPMLGVGAGKLTQTADSRAL